MQTFLLTNNFHHRKFSNKPNNEVSTSKAAATPNQKLKGRSFIPKSVSANIYYNFKNKTPYIMPNGLSVNFDDCNSYEESVKKYAKILSQVKAQQKKITVAGKTYTSLNNNSFAHVVHAACSDHFETHCIINNLNGSYVVA